MAKQESLIDLANKHVFFTEQAYMEYLAFMAVLHEQEGQSKGAAFYNQKLEEEAERLFNPKEVNND